MIGVVDEERVKRKRNSGPRAYLESKNLLYCLARARIWPMPTTTLESALQSIISEAVTRAVAAVRTDFAAKIGIPLDGVAPSPSPTAKRRGRPPGSGKKRKVAIAPAAKPTAKRAKSGRGVRTYSDAELARIIEVIKAKPGALPSHYQKASGLKENVFKAAVFKLKQDGKIKVVGKARNTSYRVA